MRRFLILALTPTLLWAAMPIRAAETFKPVVVVSVSSYEKLVQDIRFFLDPRIVALGAEVFKQSLGVPLDPSTLSPIGWDARRPLILVVETDGQTYPMYGFLPTTELNRLLASSVAAGKLKPPAGGVFQVSAADQTWFVTQKAHWAVFANSRGGLNAAPSEPTRTLAALNASHDLAIRVYLRNLPSEARKVAGLWLKEGHQVVLDRRPGESDLELAVRNAAANQGLQWAASLAEDGDMFVAGLSLDLHARSAVVDLETTARPGTSTAESLAAPHKAKSDFGGFLTPTAMLSGMWTGEIARMPLYRALNVFDAVVGQLAPDQNHQPVADFWQSIRESLLAESVDGGVAIAARANGLTLTLGGSIPDGAKLERRLKEMAAVTTEQASGEGLTWKLDVARFQDIRLHEVSIPIPKNAKDRATLVRLLGESMEAAVGIGDQSVYVAMGKNPVAAIKHVAQGSRAKGPRKQQPVQVTLSLATLARFLADLKLDNDVPQLARLADLLEQTGGKDHVKLTAGPIERGLHARLETEEGVLRALANLLGSAQPARAAPRARK